MFLLFYETVHSINAVDYPIEQLNAWAPIDEIEVKLENWRESLSDNYAYVAEIDNKIIGFCDINDSGHLDRLYIHMDFQKQGISTTLVYEIESKAKEIDLYEISTEASITAKTFFERQGYQVIKSQIVELSNVPLINYRMIKKLNSEDHEC